MAVHPVHRRRVRGRSHWGFAVGPGMVVGMIAAIGVVVSMFLSWRVPSVHPSEIPAAFLWDRGATSDPSFLIYLIPAAALLAVGALVRGGAPLRLVGGIGMLVVAVVFAYQLHRATDAIGADFGDALDAGFYVAAISGLFGFVSAFLPRTYAPRHIAAD